MKRFFVGLLLAGVVVGPRVGSAQDYYGPVVLQDAATATGAGTAFVTNRWPYQTIQAVVTGTATVQCQGSTDGVTYETIGTLTATGSCVMEGAWQYIRANISVCTGCTVTAKAWMQR